MTAEFGPLKYRKWTQRGFYVMVGLGVLAIVVVQFVK
jgi:hypothetical protein